MLVCRHRARARRGEGARLKLIHGTELRSTME
jgi:hypothetical protein